MRTPLIALAFIVALPFAAHAVDVTDGMVMPATPAPAPTNDQPDAEVGIDAAQLNKKPEATRTVTGAELDSRDKGRLRGVEDYFNSIKTLKADFTQTIPDGRQAHGTIYLKRPGKMRLEYAPPNKDLLVADGEFVHVWDSSAKNSSSVPLGTSLADVILRDQFKFSGDIKVTKVNYFPSMLEVTVVQSDNPSAGSLTLEFEDNPLKLRNWRVVDATGQETRVALAHEEINQDIPSDKFYYRDPAFGGIKK